MEPEGSLLCSQEPTSFYPMSDEPRSFKGKG